MKSLLLLRHAKSSWKNTRLADHDRPLNKRGRRDAPRMGRLLREEGVVPDLIITSTAERALSTAEAVASAGGYENEIKYTRQLYHGWIGTFIEVINSILDDYDRVMLVGHNPGMEEFVEQLTGQSVRMPTAALAYIELPIERWQQLDEDTEGRLIDLWRPREIS